MTHYPIERWTDFARGLLPEPARSEMELHLSGGCRSCARLVTLLRSVVATAERDVEVPAAVVANALAIFVARPERGESRWRKLIASLIFDSQAELALEGVRGARGAARRLAFSVEDFAVELLIDVGGRQRTLAITGQISTARKSVEPPVMEVLVMSGRDVLERTRTNEFGEFHLEFPSRAGLRLCIPDEAGGCEIEVPLGSVAGLRYDAGTK